MLSPTLFRTVKDNPNRLNHSSPLAKGVVFAWAGNSGAEVLSGTRPVVTGATFGTRAGRPSYRLTGTAGDSGSLNFGTLATAANLAQGPSTYAFYYSINDPQAGWANLASRSNGDTSGGWSCRGGSSTVYFTVSKSTTVMFAGFSGGITNNAPGTVVFTYTGGNTAATDIKCYVNGKLATLAFQQDGVGSLASDASTNLYLGASRVSGTDFSLNGDIMVGVLANRVWSDAEVAEFAKDPYGIFGGSRSVQTFSPPPPGSISGIVASSSGGSGTISDYCTTPRLLPTISGCVGNWPLQNSLADISGNGLDLIVNAGTEAYTTQNGSIVGFNFDRSRTLKAPISALLQLGGEMTIQCLVKLRDASNVATWFMSYPGTNVNSQLFHWYQNVQFRYTDAVNGTSNPNLGPPYFNVADLLPSTYLLTVRKTSTGGSNYLVETLVNGTKVASGFAGFTTQAVTPAGTEQLWIGGYHGGPELDAIMSSLRVLNYARSDANVRQDTIDCLASYSRGTSAMTGTLAPFSGLAGIIAASAGLSGTLVGQGALAGTIAASTTFTGTGSGGAAPGPMAGTIAALAALTGTLTGRGALGGSIFAVGGLSGTLEDHSLAIAHVIVAASNDSRSCGVVFSGPVNPADASDPTKYTINHGLIVTKATRVTDTYYVLTTTRQTHGTLYTLTISGIGLA